MKPQNLAVKVRSKLLDAATHALLRLGLAPSSVEWFIYAFVRKGAVISSQMEGSQAGLVDLLNYEAVVQPDLQSEIEVKEVRGYEALKCAREQLFMSRKPQREKHIIEFITI